MRWENKKGTVELSFVGQNQDASSVLKLLEKGLAHQNAGRLQEAEAIFQSILQEQPRHPDALHLLGVIAHQVGKHEMAVKLIENAIKINPTMSEFYNNLGNVFLELGRPEDAIARYEQALAIRPDFAEVHNNIGYALQKLGRPEDAITSYKQALAIKPDFAEAHNNLGNALLELGRQTAAIVRYEQALAIKPDYTEAYNNMGNALLELGRQTAAIVRYEQALAIKPDYAEAYNNMGNALLELGRMDDAIARYEQALAIKPDFAEVHNNMGNALRELGRPEEAIICYEQALAIKPDFAGAQSNRLMTLNYLSSILNSNLFDNTKGWATSLEKQTSDGSFDNIPNPNRQLKIGYVSADFRNHPVGYFISSVLPFHDNNHFDVTCYSNSPLTDDITISLQKSVKQWHNIVGLSDDDTASLIRNDCIDILVDLSGHTSGNRLTLFAKRPAPIQVSWIGYFATTGLTAMDYILADRFVVPEQEEHFYTEKVRCLPDSYLCFDPPKFDLEIHNTPAKLMGVFTFGSFNNYCKLSPETITLWAKILNAVPSSRLLLKHNQYSNPSVQQFVHDRFANHNIDNNRVIMEGRSPRQELLVNYQHIDIALDPFPFGGGTTTAECLWMGVPVITMKGDRWVGRVSESILNAVGLPELVADNLDAYRSLAITLSNDIPRLESLRFKLRKTMEASPFCDGKRFTKNLEMIYQSMWKDWCHL